MSDFLLELRCEEIPARMQAGARAELEKLFRRELDSAGVAVGELTVWSTPRRLALIARGLPDATAAVSEEAKGPPVGAPDAAVEGFCRKLGITRETLEVRDLKGRETFFAVIDKPGRAMRDLLAGAIPAIIRDFGWPKSMRWGEASLSTESLRWVRPLSGIVAILGEDLVDCAIDGIQSGYATRGHRFHTAMSARPEPVEGREQDTLRQAQGERGGGSEITIGSAADYAEKLRACHVIVDHEERAAIIRSGAARVANEAGLALVADEGLVIENAGLTEWPVPLLGRFDADYLDVPPEVIQLTARVNQKYFVCNPPRNGEGDHPQDGGGASSTLANAFICTANIDAVDPAVVVDGNRKVLAARLSDARFFWEQDRKTPLAEHAKKLERITFHEKLGTVADKVERVARLARWLVEEGIILPGTGRGTSKAGGGARAASASGQDLTTSPVPLHHPADGPPPPAGEDLADLAEQAARLCKADLVTEMVGEFPELQGLMGGYYARAEGLDPAVCDAIRDHYKPVGQGDDVPTAPVTVAVSLADKLDTLCAFFAISEKPTGSKDPFALRRAAISIIGLILERKQKIRLRNEIFDHLWRFSTIGDQSTRTKEALNRLDLVRRLKSEFGLDLPSEAYRNRKNIERNAERKKVLEEIEKFLLVTNTLFEFIIDRLKVQQREAGVRHDLIDAVFALGGEDDLVRLLARVHALQAFIASDNGTNLLAAYKRAANILRKENWQQTPLPEGEGLGEGAPASDNRASLSPLPTSPLTGGGALHSEGLAHLHTPSYTPEPAERALVDALDAAEPRANAAIAAEDFAAAMAALASLRVAVDAFFEEVTVNADDPAKRAARLDLLARFRAAVHNVADFSRIEG